MKEVELIAWKKLFKLSKITSTEIFTNILIAFVNQLSKLAEERTTVSIFDNLDDKM